MTLHAELIRALDLVYAAASAPDGWPTALAAIARTLGGERAVFENLHPRERGRPAGAGPVIDLTGDRRLEAWIVGTEDHGRKLVIERGPNDRPFGAADVAHCATIAAHLERALVIAGRLQELEVHRAAAREALDRFPVGVILLDASGRPRLTNRSAQAIVEKRDGLMVSNGRLTTSRGPDATALQRLLGARPLVPGVIRIRRPSHARCFALVIAPLERLRELPDTDAPVAVAFVCDPDAQHEPFETLLETLYELTPAEAVVATLLMQGERIEAISEHLDVSLNTTRTHLKRIYSKTGVASQSGLVRLLLTGPAQLRLGAPRSAA